MCSSWKSRILSGVRVRRNEIIHTQHSCLGLGRAVQRGKHLDCRKHRQLNVLTMVIQETTHSSYPISLKRGWDRSHMIKDVCQHRYCFLECLAWNNSTLLPFSDPRNHHSWSQCRNQTHSGPVRDWIWEETLWGIHSHWPVPTLPPPCLNALTIIFSKLTSNAQVSEDVLLQNIYPRGQNEIENLFGTCV